jgi:hypothetical protein
VTDEDRSGAARAGLGDWRASAFLLERKHRARWGRHETVDATVNTQRAQDIERRLLKGRELMQQYAKDQKG